MNEFISGRIAVVVESGNCVRLLDAESREDMLTDAPWLGGEELAALREFFRAEEDERLGRWRWPENPDYVVYPDESGKTEVVEVLCESTGMSLSSTRTGNAPHRDAHADAARAYFDAHPEPKPWHEAQIDEVWLLTIDGVEEAYRTEMVSHVRFFAIRAENGMTYGTRSSEITAGRRIYPVSS
ncbi:hypothetical protein [Microbacterium sp. NPDC055455]